MNTILKTSTDSALLNKLVKSIFPTLTFDLHKGQCGRIGVVGGSFEYTGAPYFAAITSLKVGCDVPHVFCPRDAAQVIKTYSPDLIVHPVLNPDTPESAMKEPMDRMHSLVLGPGLGRWPESSNIFHSVLSYAGEHRKALVIDADGLFFVAQSPTVLQNIPCVVLTPNEMEFSRIFNTAFKAECAPAADTTKAVEETKELCRRLGNVTVIRKGNADMITDGTSVLICDAPTSPRRCGGQGDLLSGSLGTFLHWATNLMTKNIPTENNLSVNPPLIATYAACLLTRYCNKLAYDKFGRSMTTNDMIDCIHVALNGNRFLSN